MVRWLWMTTRFTLSAWVGAAALFVVAGIREVTSTQFEAATKNQLAVLRFPAYYAFGFVLVSVGTTAVVCLACTERNRRRTTTTLAALCGVALITMVVDYLWIYSPLEAMMVAPEGTVDPRFWQYHVWSKYVNFASVGLCAIAALVAAAEPRRSEQL